MAGRAEDVNIARLRLDVDDSDVEGLFDSPPRAAKDPVPYRKVASTTPQEPVPTTVLPKRDVNETQNREKALHTELGQLQQMNTTLEGLNRSLSTAKVNLETMQTNMDSAKTLLKTWSRILSQAEHDQRLILNSRWQGATQDLEDIANDDVRRQADAQHKILEETARREAARRKEEDAARRREEEAQRKTRGSMGRSRSVRGSAKSSNTTTRGQSNALSGRGRGGTTRGTTSGIARGSTVRGRGRGG